jgi:hypothetical protein
MIPLPLIHRIGDSMTQPSNLTIRSGIRLNAVQQTFVEALARRVGTNVPVIVTSGGRTVRTQAAIIKRKAEKQGWAAILRVYGRRYHDLMKAAHPSISSMANVAAMFAGPNTHLSGNAVDLSSRMPLPQLKALMQAALDLGAKVLWEKPGGGSPPVVGVKVSNISPDHLHVSRLQGALSLSVKKRGYWLGVTGGVSAVVLLLGWVWWKKRTAPYGREWE